jgi:hypothetical protein
MATGTKTDDIFNSEQDNSETTICRNPDSKTILIEVAVANEILEFSEGDGTRLVEHAIRMKYSIEGGSLQRNSRVYLGSSLFKSLTEKYVFTGGSMSSELSIESSCALPGIGWAISKKGRAKNSKCPCCT